MPTDWKKYASGALAGLLAVGALVGVRPASSLPEIPAGSKIEQVDEGVRRIAVEGGYLYQWNGSGTAFVSSSR